MNREIKLNEETMIVSETDTSGKIIYANSDFCKIAEYEKNEIIGQAHNILRHKDMPSEAFEDLWNTLKKGQIWNGIVKNSTKNGNYYWVNATAFSSKDTNGDTRYISVRIKPTDEEIKSAEALYKINQKPI